MSTNLFSKFIIFGSISEPKINDTIGIKETTERALNAEDRKDDIIKKKKIKFKIFNMF